MSGSNPMEFAFFLLLNLLRANGSLPATSNYNKELIFANGGFHHHKHHHPIIRHNNPLPLSNSRANEFQEMASQLPIKKLPLREMTKRGQQKRLTLYPTMDLDEKQQNQQPSPAPSIPQKSHHSWQKHRRPMHWLGHRGETRIGQRKSNGNKKYEFVRESIQTCLFLRSGCQKIQHSAGHSNRRLASFVQNLDVQERISNGFVLQRKSKKKKTRRSRLL